MKLNIKIIGKTEDLKNIENFKMKRVKMIQF